MNIMLITQITIFTIGTIYITYISRKSFGNHNVHGFYRFFVFEFTLAVVLINISYWYSNPFSLSQILSWIFLCVSIVLLIQSFYYLKRQGKPNGRQDFPENFAFENTSSLVKEGVYKYIRHPMYGSLLFLSLGAMLKDISLLPVLLAILAFIFLFLTARVEEKENIRYFGEEYKIYMQSTKMFIPYIF